MDFSRPESWSGQPFPFPGDLPDPGIEQGVPALQVDSLPAEPPGEPKNPGVGSLSLLQGIFLTWEWNRGLLHCRRILYQLRCPLYKNDSVRVCVGWKRTKMASSFSLLKAFIHDGCAGPLLLWGLSLAAMSRGLFLAVCGLLTVAAPLGAEHRLQAVSFSSCTRWVHILRSRMHGSWALGLGLRCSKARGVFLGLPGSGIEPASPALQADFLPPSHQFR